MTKIHFIFLFLYLKSTVLTEEETCNQHKNENSYFERRQDQASNLTISFFVNFKDFNDLILDCNQTYNITQSVFMRPQNSLIINENFHLKKIFNQSQIESIEYLSIGNLKGFDLNSKPFILDSNRLEQSINFYMFMSKMNIYFNSIQIDYKKCDSLTYNTSISFLQSFYSIRLENVFYPIKWCPHFFRDFNLFYLTFSGVTNNFLIKNRLNFFQLNSSKIYLKNLRAFILSITYENLNRNNLSPELFRKIQFVDIAGIVNGIESNLFKDFKDLSIINLALSNLREFFHMGNQWMNYLNLNMNKKVIKLEFRHQNEISSFDAIYEYPNEDLCLFKYFPHERLVFPLLVPGKRLECTCTLYWLQKSLHLYENEIKMTSDYNMNYNDETFEKTFLFCNSSFNSSECRFEKIFNLCKILSKEEEFIFPEHTFSFEIDFDILYIIKFVEFILMVILAPIFCFIGIIHNGLSILIIKNSSSCSPVLFHCLLVSNLNITHTHTQIKNKKWFGKLFIFV